MKVKFVFIRVMLADVSYIPVNESYHYKMAFGLYVLEHKHNFHVIHFLSLTVLRKGSNGCTLFPHFLTERCVHANRSEAEVI